MQLYEVLARRVDGWRDRHYPSPEHDAIGEILEWAAAPETAGFRLRPPQLRALETYWYLRLIEKTPHIGELYQRLFPSDDPNLLLAALGVSVDAFGKSGYKLSTLLVRIKSDDDFVREFRLEALRETLTLDYPSYILALAMGAGKTVLIGAIFASEFGMALEYPDGPFVQNALVFAPGKTIIESLRQLAETRYDSILPPRLYKPFAASVKLTFTRDGEKDIPVARGSTFNVVVTNTEKIRIQKPAVRARNLTQLELESREQQESEVANLRLQAIASLPHLAIFSDEAHHTYGQSLDTELKKVRRTVDYLHVQSPNLICVVNTTGTPYYQRQMLRDVVIWYGLAQGIRDGILKDVAGNIKAVAFDEQIEAYLAHVVETFFADYGDVALPDGTPAKLAIYFPQTDDVEALRPVIDATLAALGRSPTLVLEHHTQNENKADFDRFKDKDSPHRIALLVDRGVEGWDVPALFACALARKLKSSNNFVLQAASRCLRQVPGNPHKARIYLSLDNYGILDRQLRETYGEQISDLEHAAGQSRHATIRLRKLAIPPLVVRQIVRTVVPTAAPAGEPKSLHLRLPQIAASAMQETTYELGEQVASYEVLKQSGDSVTIDVAPQTTDIYAAAVDLASTYRADLWTVYGELRRLYPGGELPLAHLPALAEQIEQRARRYTVQAETREVALALVKPEGFEQTTGPDGTVVYTAEISYPIDREHLLISWERMREANDGDFGFHYSPYNFDSNPELSFFEQMLAHLNLHPAEVEDIYFTGALTTPDKTDFFVEYRGQDERWHRYTPDFIIRRKDGKCFIVEVKREHDRDHAIDGEHGAKAMATRKWVGLNPDLLRYEMFFTSANTLAADQLREINSFVQPIATGDYPQLENAA
jgi:type III restriction enzyme